MEFSLDKLTAFLSENAQVYGTPLYAKVKDSASFVISANTDGIDLVMADNETLMVTSPAGTHYVSLRKSAIDAGKDETSTFTVQKYVAIRDASGTYEGKDWSVAKGSEKLFAE